MTVSSNPIIRPEERAHYRDQVWSYLCGAHLIEEREVDHYGNLLHRLAVKLPKSHTMSEAMACLWRPPGVSTKSQSSIQAQVGSLCEMYFAPEDWIALGEPSRFNEKVNAFQSLIAERVDEVSQRFLKMDLDQRQRYVRDQRDCKRLAEQNLEVLKRARRKCQVPVSTISETQQDEEDAIRGQLKDLKLMHLRDPGVSLLEDHPAIIAVMERLPTFYRDYPIYSAGNLSAIARAIELGQCNPDHLPHRHRDHPDVRRASAYWNGQVMHLVRDYFGKRRCRDLSFRSLQRALNKKKVTSDLVTCRELCDLISESSETAHIEAAARHYFCGRDGARGTAPAEVIFALHTRVMFEQIFKRQDIRSLGGELLDEPEFADSELAEVVRFSAA